jgi:pyruvate dehydrogenase E2 component (dihydrolipoamide acetyltransferase)
MEQGTFVGWLKKNGEPVRPGDALFTLEGEKAIQEIEAVDTGNLHFDPNNPREGGIVAVGAIIGYLLAAGETAPAIPPLPKPSAATPLAPSGRRAGGEGQSREALVPEPLTPSPSPRRGEANRTAIAPPASPAVRRLARQLGVDLAPFDSPGRISEADVCRRYLQSRGEFLSSVSASVPAASPVSMSHSSSVPRRSRDLPAISPRAARTAAKLGINWTQLLGTGSAGRIRERDVLAVADSIVVPPFTIPSATRTIPITALRRTIANRMVMSLQQTAPVTLTTEIDVTSLIEFRERLKRTGKSLVPSITDCFVKLTALALPEHLALNARWRHEAIEIFDEVHIGIAVDTNEGLLVPVVRDAHRQSVFEIARQSRELIESARTRRLNAHDLQGGTFTITNLGSLGIDAFTPIINFPETAILGLGRIQTQTPVSMGEPARPRQTMTLSLTFDHRVLDGAPAARFLQSLAKLTTTDVQSPFGPSNHR